MAAVYGEQQIVGDSSLAVEDQPDKAKATSKPPARPHAPAAATHNRDVGQALRSVYQKTVDERIPDEFLDLLGKLG